MKFNVRVRIITPHNRAIHEDQEIEAETGLDAMKLAQADEKNTVRGLVQTNGCDPLPLDGEPVIVTKGEAVADEPPKPRGRPPKHQTTAVE